MNSAHAFADQDMPSTIEHVVHAAVHERAGHVLGSTISRAKRRRWRNNPVLAATFEFDRRRACPNTIVCSPGIVTTRIA